MIYGRLSLIVDIMLSSELLRKVIRHVGGGLETYLIILPPNQSGDSVFFGPVWFVL